MSRRARIKAREVTAVKTPSIDRRNQLRIKEGKKPYHTKNIRYPWAEWWELGAFELRQGRDYLSPSYPFAQQVRNRAVLDGLRVSVTVVSGEKERIRVKVLGER